MSFNPRAPYGARRGPPPWQGRHHRVSIHAPRTGRDLGQMSQVSQVLGFNPRAPYGARPVSPAWADDVPVVSIHAPRTGRDRAEPRRAPLRLVSIHAPRTGRDLPSHGAPPRGIRGFNPRAPYGARHDSESACRAMREFQSTRPVRGATEWGVGKTYYIEFQSTRPVRGATISPSGA